MTVVSEVEGDVVVGMKAVVVSVVLVFLLTVTAAVGAAVAVVLIGVVDLGCIVELVLDG